MFTKLYIICSYFFSILILKKGEQPRIEKEFDIMKKKIFRVFNEKNEYIGYFPANELELAKNFAYDLGGRIEEDYVTILLPRSFIKNGDM